MLERMRAFSGHAAHASPIANWPSGGVKMNKGIFLAIPCRPVLGHVMAATGRLLPGDWLCIAHVSGGQMGEQTPPNQHGSNSIGPIKSKLIGPGKTTAKAPGEHNTSCGGHD
jgi:hypothetical protein